ncbi:MAG: FKBP-type peptidyl-prolyl cis-trans isomerase [Chlamydiia bacterium]|nr:FKBP-type peptidyl-prolyl cis-trans isomerase [Chlamydiia bacterium]
MNKMFSFPFLLLIIFATLQANEVEEIDVNTVSKAVGHVIARQFVYPGFSFNFDKVIEGMQEAREGKASPMTDQEIEQALATIQETVFLKTAEENLEKANSFLKKNQTEKGVVSLEEKLQYKVIQMGQGEEICVDSVPKIHYRGTLVDGTEFANSRDGEPVEISLDQTIAGFSKGITGMKEGEIRILYIHPDLGYGMSSHLPPNSLLIFEIELMKIQEQKTIASEEA